MDDEVGGPQPMSVRMFVALYLAILIPLMVVTAPFSHHLARTYGKTVRPLQDLMLLGLAVFAFVLEGSVLKRFGRPWTRTREVWTRTVAEQANPVDGGETLELRPPVSLAVPLSLLALLLGGIFMFWGISGERPPIDEFPPALLIVFGSFQSMLGVVGLWKGRVIGPGVRADAMGIEGDAFCLPWPRRRYVAWAEVASCEVATYINPFGQTWLIVPTLKMVAIKGSSFRFNVGNLTLNDQHRLVEFIRTHLPKLDKAGWDEL